jgi:hypothetical protein
MQARAGSPPTAPPAGTAGAWFQHLGATQAILIVTLTTCVVFLAVTRRWRPVLFIAIVMAGEIVAFLIAAAVVKRSRPDVPRLDHARPTRSARPPPAAPPPHRREPERPDYRHIGGSLSGPTTATSAGA